MIWHKFPALAPHDGTPIVVGGRAPPLAHQNHGIPLIQPGSWVQMVASYHRFRDQPWILCERNEDPMARWVTSGFQTLYGLNVIWEVWTEIPSPPLQLEE